MIKFKTAPPTEVDAQFAVTRQSIEEAKQALFRMDVTRLRLARQIECHRENPVRPI